MYRQYPEVQECIQRILTMQAMNSTDAEQFGAQLRGMGSEIPEQFAPTGPYSSLVLDL